MNITQTTILKDREHIPRGMLLAAMNAVLFALMQVCVKLASASHPVEQTLFFRNAVALLPFAVMIMLSGGPKILRIRQPFYLGMRILCGMTAMLCTFQSFAVLPLSQAATLGFLSVIFLTILSVPLLGEHVGWHRWAAVGVGFVGMLFVTRPEGDVLQLGVIWGLIAGLARAFVKVFVRKLNGTDQHPLSIPFYFALVFTVLLAPLMPFIWQPMDTMTTVWMMATGVLGFLIQLTVTYSMRYAPPVLLGPFSYTTLIWMTGFDLLIWKILPDQSVWIGAGLIIISGIYIALREIRHKKIQKGEPQPNPPAQG